MEQNCGQIIDGQYCKNCGKPLNLKRIDRNYVTQEVLNLIGFEKGFAYTCKQLPIRPGETIREYINKNRQNVTKPITFLVISSVIYTLISYYLKADILYFEIYRKAYGDSSIKDIMSWVQNNYGYANLMMTVPIVLWIKLFFRKHQYNFYEIFVVIAFVMGMGMLFLSFEPVVNKFFPSSFMINQAVIFLIVFIYMGWAIGQFFGNSFRNYVKAFLGYVFGTITFQVVAITIGIIYDLSTK